MLKRTALLAAAAALALVACGKRDKAVDAAKPVETAPATSEPVSEPAAGPASPAADPAKAAANKAASEKFLADKAGAPGVKALAGGLLYEVLKDGEGGGAAPTAGDLVDVDFVGTRIDGTEFESSRLYGAAARFPVSEMEGTWMSGALKAMSVGDRYRFFVPAAMALGENGSGDGRVGPNEAVIYEVELLRITNPERNLKAGAAYLAENAKKPCVRTTQSGLQYQVVSEGPAGGKSPTDASVVRVHYKGALIDGTEFDSSIARGEPAEFAVGQVIAGWTEGLQLMSVGDKFRFVIPANLAYGPAGKEVIGPNETLVFEVELLDVVPDQATAAQ